MKFKVGDEVLIKGKVVHVGYDISAPYRIQTELYIDDYKQLFGNDDDLVAPLTSSSSRAADACSCHFMGDGRIEAEASCPVHGVNPPPA